MKIVVAGAGGHGKVVLDALLASGLVPDDIVGFSDENPAVVGTVVMGYPVFAGLEAIGLAGEVRVAMGIGGIAARRRCFERARTLGYEVISVIHPRAVIGRGCALGVGVVVMANVVINADTSIGDNVILNTASSVDHDCRIGNHVHLGPGVRIAGGVSIGDETLLGTGAIVIPGMSIGERSVVGAGAVVVRNIGPACVAVGVPARVIK
ncbi:MAG: NeuD/PglB/VioB family sugar acetyltransferase [Acidobacteriota bacterium]|nr:NeuD/PglB/VioB family sugar acetyltransferase [Acidobacteriota bacterium]